MSDSLLIRPATIDDVPGIQAIHAHCDDPWAHPGEGAVWINHRLLRGYFIDVALVGDAITGHAEWIVSHEPEPHGKQLYLGMLQVHADWQGRGIGRAMVAAGGQRAASLACPRVYTVPEVEAVEFYRKCGFSRTATIMSLEITCGKPEMPAGWARSNLVPARVVLQLPFRLGWAGQAASAFMWDLCNWPICIAGDKAAYPCARRQDGRAYAQLRWIGGDGALALAWAGAEVPLAELIAACQALAAAIKVANLTLSAPGAEGNTLAGLFPEFTPTTQEVWSRQI